MSSCNQRQTQVLSIVFTCITVNIHAPLNAPHRPHSMRRVMLFRGRIDMLMCRTKPMRRWQVCCNPRTRFQDNLLQARAQPGPALTL